MDTDLSHTLRSGADGLQKLPQQHPSLTAKFTPLREAARRLGENPETTRLRAKRGELKGEQRGRGREWFIDSASLAALLAARGGPKGLDARLDAMDTRIDALGLEMQKLLGEMRALEHRHGTRSVDLEEVGRERDRYRAAASTFRETAIRANAAQRSMVLGFRQLLDAMDANADAVTQVLGPQSTEDLTGAPSTPRER